MARSNKSIYIALGANVAIATTKFVAGAVTGSSAMTSEANIRGSARLSYIPTNGQVRF